MDPCPVLVGRQEEMAALRRLLDAGGGVAVISGEAGIGKSRLVREFAAEAAQRRRIVLWGRPEEVAQPGPYALIADLLESVMERGGENVALNARTLEGKLLQGLDATGSSFAPTSRSIAAEIRGLVSQLELAPLVVLEDLHSADEASHSVLMHLVRSAKDDGHIVVATYRQETLDLLPSMSRLVGSIERERVGIRIDIQPLRQIDVEAMLELMLPGIKEREKDRIIELGEGVPFFIEELADAAATGGVPKTIEVAVASRLHSLGPEVSEVVRVASLIAGAIDHRVIATATNRTLEQISDALVEAVASGLLVDREGKLTFRHSLMRSEISESIVSVRKTEMHRRLADAIERIYPRDVVLHSSALARHYQGAGDGDRAAKYLLLAGERALAVAATEEARAHFSEAHSLSSEYATKAKRGLAEVEFREGNQEQAAKLFREAADELVDASDRVGAARSLGRLAWALRSEAHSESAIAALDEALELVPSEADSDHAALLVDKGQTLLYQFLGRFREARPILERGVELARKQGDESLVAGALDGLAHVADWEANFKEALRFGEESLIAAISSGSAEVIGRTHNNHAIRLTSYGYPADGLATLAAGRRHLQEAFGPAGVGALDVSRAWISWLMGIPTEVADLTARGGAAWQRWHGYRQMMEIWAAVEQHQFSRAEQRLQAEWTELGGEFVHEGYLAGTIKPKEEARHILFSEAYWLLRSERFDDAVRASSIVANLDESLGSEAFETGQGLALYAQALIGARRIESAIEAESSLRKLLDRSCPYPYLQAQLEEIRASITEAQEGSSSAKPHFSEAARLFELCGNKSDRARCLRRLAGAHLASESDRDEAIASLRTARDLSNDSGALAEKDHIEAVLRSLGVRVRGGRPAKSESDRGISRREAEVAVLVAAGETNAEIARKLFLSERTVQDHITNALRKLHLSGRAGLATWAVKQGLV